METISDPFELDGVQLRRGNGKVFTFEPYSFATRRHSLFMASKSRVVDWPAGGVVVQLSDRELLFLGIEEEALVLASEQKFDLITNYKTEARSQKRTVECKFSVGRFSELQLPRSVKDSTVQVGAYFYFRLNGILHHSPDGLVFGILPLPEV